MPLTPPASSTRSSSACRPARSLACATRATGDLSQVDVYRAVSPFPRALSPHLTSLRSGTRDRARDVLYVRGARHEALVLLLFFSSCATTSSLGIHLCDRLQTGECMGLRWVLRLLMWTDARVLGATHCSLSSILRPPSSDFRPPTSDFHALSSSEGCSAASCLRIRRDSLGDPVLHSN